MSENLYWVAAELHTHTRHSDGVFSTEQLLYAAKAWGVDLVAITDHNTRAPLREATKALQMQTLPVVAGIEWTTFFGHLVVLGGERDVDWRDATPANIHQKLTELKDGGALCGIAHPFALGSPLCTGCHWGFGLSHYRDIDYIEIWSEDAPTLQVANQRAVAWWHQLLDEGWRLAATYGRDWHGEQPDVPRAITLLRTAGEPSAAAVLEAIRAGRTAVTMGPMFTLQTPGGFGPGDTLAAPPQSVQVDFDMSYRAAHWQHHGLRPKQVVLRTKGGRVAAKAEISAAGGSVALPAEGAQGYLLAELHGELQGQNCMLATTSPLYIGERFSI